MGKSCASPVNWPFSPRSTAGQLLSRIRHKVDMNIDRVISQNNKVRCLCSDCFRQVIVHTGLTIVSMHKGVTHLPMLLLRNGQTHKIDSPTAYPEPDPWLCSETVKPPAAPAIANSSMQHHMLRPSLILKPLKEERSLCSSLTVFSPYLRQKVR